MLDRRAIPYLEMTCITSPTSPLNSKKSSFTQAVSCRLFIARLALHPRNLPHNLDKWLIDTNQLSHLVPLTAGRAVDAGLQQKTYEFCRSATTGAMVYGWVAGLDVKGD